MAIINTITGGCSYDGCNAPATTIASGQRSYTLDRPLQPGQYPTGIFCDAHATIVADFDGPEYQDECPNCGCRFGVN